MGCCIVKRSFTGGGVDGGVKKKKCTPRPKPVGVGKKPLNLDDLAKDVKQRIETCSDNENWEYQIAVCEELGTNMRPGRWALSVRVAEMVDWYPHVRDRLDKKELNKRCAEEKHFSKQ